ncbi:MULTISPECIES: hypothetical protein [Vibrio]|nr:MULTISPECIES: hypothetical protein [Vibrio]MCO7020947.1 hypothetical protein [Vibrio paracholerae]
MKQRWTTKAKLLRNLIVAAKLRGDNESAQRLEQQFNEEMEKGDEQY